MYNYSYSAGEAFTNVTNQYSHSGWISISGENRPLCHEAIPLCAFFALCASIGGGSPGYHTMFLPGRRGGGSASFYHQFPITTITTEKSAKYINVYFMGYYVSYIRYKNTIQKFPIFLVVMVVAQ
jgi:hypothetical protein